MHLKSSQNYAYYTNSMNWMPFAPLFVTVKPHPWVGDHARTGGDIQTQYNQRELMENRQLVKS